MIKGKALLLPLVEEIQELAEDDDSKLEEAFPPEKFRAPCDLLVLANRLDPDNEEAALRVEQVEGLVPTREHARTLPPERPNHPHPLDVVVVGAGAAGVGMGVMLSKVFGCVLPRSHGTGSTP